MSEKLSAEDRAKTVNFYCTEDDAHTYPESECRKSGFCYILINQIAYKISEAEQAAKSAERELIKGKVCDECRKNILVAGE